MIPKLVNFTKKTDNMIEVSSVQTHLRVGRIMPGPGNRFVFMPDAQVDYYSVDVMKEISDHMQLLDNYGKGRA